MNRRSDSIVRSESLVRAEQRVVEARMDALEQYRAARANLHRRAGSPLFIGGVLLGATALGYLAFGRGKSKPHVPHVYTGSPGLWSQLVTTAQVLLPLLIALNSATRAERRPRADVGGTAGLNRRTVK